MGFIYLCITMSAIGIAFFIWLMTPSGQRWWHEK